jgi:hypothetical protein
VEHLPNYFAENELVQQLETRPVKSKRQRSYSPNSLRSLLKRYARDNLKLLAAHRIWSKDINGRVLYQRLRDLQNSEGSRRVLVIGNGPSQELLCLEDLIEFKQTGGHILAVNNYFNSEALVRCGPSAVVWSDPASIPALLANEAALARFRASIQNSPEVRFFVPSRLADMAAKLCETQISGEVILFCDSEARIRGLKESQSIRPDRPRSYVSMTLFKALAIALWLGYRDILLVGMDNTYPRDIYCSPDNTILLRERHAFETDYVHDISSEFATVSDFLYEIALLMSDTRKFQDPRVRNLDPYSLTDAYPKARDREHSRAILRGTEVG